MKRVWLVLALCIALVVWFFPEIKALWQALLVEIQLWQNVYRREISSLINALRRSPSWQAWWALIGAGFAYGVLHAAGPGHGKAVIGTFLLTQKSTYKSALGLAVGSALLQGLSAVLWVGATLGLLQWLLRDALAQVIWLERVSHALIVCAGIYLIWRASRKTHTCCAHHHHDHHHEHDREHGGYGATMLAVGLRPCSGSIVALAVAGGWGMWGVGIAMTVAVSIGTALTVLTPAHNRQPFPQTLSASCRIGHAFCQLRTTKNRE